MRARRGAAALVPLLLIAACTSNTDPDAGPTTSTGDSRGGLPSTLEVETTDVIYGIAGTQALTPIGDRTIMTLGVVIQNRSTSEVRISEVEVAEAAGLTATPRLVIRTPRAVTQIHGAMGFPPPRNWDPTAEAAYSAFALPPGSDSARWGALVLLRVDVTEQFAYAKGLWIRGTQDGHAFEDFVDTFYGYCKDGNADATPECTDFANQHAFTPFGPPGG